MRIAAKSRSRYLQGILVGVLVLAGSAAVAADSFPGRDPDRRVWGIQQKADGLFEQGDYERAMFIYRNELAPLGDKYAQYMVGFLHLAGKGVPADAILASAWYRLAAERGDKTLVGERDKLMAFLNDEQKALSDRAFGELRAELGDATLVTRLIEEDLGLLSDRAYLSVSSGPIIDGRKYVSREAYLKGVANRIRERLLYLDDIVAEDASLGEAERERYRVLEARVREALSDL